MATRRPKNAQPDSAAPPRRGGSLAWLNPAKWLEVIAGVVSGSLGNAPKEQVAFIVISFLGTAVAILGSTVLIWKGEYVLGGALCVIGLVFLAFGMWCVGQKGPISITETQTDQTRESRTREWSRVTVKVPIEPQRLKELAGKVKSIRDVAQRGYSAVFGDRGSSPSHKDLDSVRVNVFLPDTRDVRYGEVCALFIPKGLHHGMKNDAEREIQFRPGEGVTGQVFTREQPIGTRRTSAKDEWQWIDLEGSAGTGDDKFPLTQMQMSQIDKELRWIVSFPLTVTVANTPHTVGVLNIDGLSEMLSPREMQTIYNNLKPTVDDFAKDLAELDKCRITIAVEDIAAEAPTSTG
jgi:hypothetical protein